MNTLRESFQVSTEPGQSQTGFKGTWLTPKGITAGEWL